MSPVLEVVPSNAFVKFLVFSVDIIAKETNISFLAKYIYQRLPPSINCQIPSIMMKPRARSLATESILIIMAVNLRLYTLTNVTITE